MDQELSIVGVAGGSGAGKTTLVRALSDALGGSVESIAHDSYYRDLGTVLSSERAKVNFDAPEALETELLIEHLDALRAGDSVVVPEYDFSTHTRIPDAGRDVQPAPIVIVEGILLFADPQVCDRLDIRVFVDADADLRILRRLRRDVEERGRTVSSVMEQYLETVKPMHYLHVEPSRKHADLVVNGAKDMTRAIDLIASHIRSGEKAST